MSPSLAFVFPGQGSQFVGMLADTAEKYPEIRETFNQASTVLGRDLFDLATNGPEAELNKTDITQPILLTASVALWRVWCEQGGAMPAAMSGHSLGEYSALVCAGAIGFEDAVRLVNQRGKFMQEAVPAGEGAMAAILGLADPDIAAACKVAEQGQVVSPVNFNSPGQVVIAGQAAAVERAMAACKEAGAKRALLLPVSVPSHCALMMPAAERLAKELGNISVSSPTIPVVQNVSAKVADNVDELKDNLVKQLYCPVLWVDCVGYLVAKGATRLIECGPGNVLSGLNKRINRELTLASIGNLDGLTKQLSE
jgi:[acyl-carrier-protein] S-malonyltransferase